MNTYFVGQVPARPAVFTVVDDYEDPIDLSSYTVVALVLRHPFGQIVDTSAGYLSRAQQSDGLIAYYWPQTSLFDEPGSYRFQLKLTGSSGVSDLTQIGQFEVRLPLGE